MHKELWAGIESKFQNAEFHFRKMGQSLDPPERTGVNVALQSSGAIIDTGWQRSFYAHLDAFLSAAKSVPEIIQCCFGVDRARAIKDWFEKLPSAELTRRAEFKKQFKASYDCFRILRLSTARHVSEHRTDFAPVKVRINGLFGVTYVGDPTIRVPIAETRQFDDPGFGWLAKPIPLQPRWDNFDIEGQPLFPTCDEYLNAARSLIDEAHRISDRIHGTESLTSPPS